MTDDSPQVRGELRTLSSERTEFAKVLRVVAAVLFTIAAIASLFSGNTVRIAVLLVVSIACWAWAWVAFELKEVETDGYWLLASSMSKTAWIPLTKIVSVSRVWFPDGQRIYVGLDCDTPFGREIVFEPAFELAGILGQHPVIREIQQLVARAKTSQSQVPPGTAAPG